MKAKDIMATDMAKENSFIKMAECIMANGMKIKCKV